MKNIISLFIALAIAGSATAQKYEAVAVTEGGSYKGLSLYQAGKLAFTNDGKLYEATINGSQLTDVKLLENVLPKGWVADGLAYDKTSDILYVGAKAPKSNYAIYRISGSKSPEQIFPLGGGTSGSYLVNVGWVMKNKSYNAMHPALSNGGKRLWFTSNIPGGKGSTDIWYMDMQADGSWAKPINAEAINTDSGEEYPFVAADKFFFSSDALINSNFGGKDIYVAALSGGIPQGTQNIDEPISSSAKDVNFVLANKQAWFISNRDGNTRIYTIGYPKEEPKAEPAPAPAPKPEPAPAPAPAPKPAPQPQPAPAPAPKADVLKELNIPKLEFAYNSAKLLPASEKYIPQIAQALKERPNTVFEVAGHTDLTGDATRNQTLSQKRAEYVMQSLIAKGVPAKNLKAKGYGINQPLKNCTTQECNTVNRRVEINPVQ